MARSNWFFRQILKLDPGGLNTARGAQICLSTFVAGSAGYAAHAWTGLAVPNLTVYSAAFAAHCLLFTSPGSRRQEAVSITRNAAVALAVYLLALIVGWGSIDPSGDLVHIAWVPVISASFFLRRYGIIGTQCGLVLALAFMFVVIGNPTREDAAWLPLAALMGYCSAMVFRVFSWRPSSLAAFDQKRNGIIEAFGRRLQSAEETPLKISDLRNEWMELSRFSRNAALEHPDQATTIESDVVRLLRVLMSGQYIADLYANISAMPEPDRTSHQAFKKMRQLTAAALINDGRFDEEFRQLLQQLSETTKGDGTVKSTVMYYRFQLLQGYRRIYLLMTAPPPSKTKTRQTTETPADPWPAYVGNRMALQGLVAAGVTTALAFMFDLPNGYWATMTVLVVLNGTAGAAVTRMAQRAGGTIVGVVGAIICQALLDSVTFGIVTGTLALVAVFVMIDRYYLIASALIAYTVLTALHLLEGAGPAVEMARIYDTVLGAAAGLAAAWLVFPVKSEDRIGDRLTTLYQETLDYVKSARRPDVLPRNKITALENSARTLAALLPELEAERMLKLQPRQDFRSRLAFADALVAYATLYVDAVDKLRKSKPSEAVEVPIKQIQTLLESAFDTTIGVSHKAAIQINETQLPPPSIIGADTAMILVRIRYYAFKASLTLEDLNKSRPDAAANA